MSIYIPNEIKVFDDHKAPWMNAEIENFRTSSKCFWSLLKRPLNDKKIPVIPPLFHNNNFISNFKEKGKKLFNEHSSEQCSLIQNKSTIPSVFKPLTYNLFSSFQFTTDDIKSIITKLDPTKAHGHDMISICMIILCGDSIYISLEIIFKSCLNQDIFPAEWKKADAVPVHKKGNHQCAENYRPVFLLPVSIKIFERQFV